MYTRGLVFCHGKPMSRFFLLFCVLLTLLGVSPPKAHAFTATIQNGDKSIYLRVGDGGFVGYFTTDTKNAVGANLATVNTVAVTGPPNVMGNGVGLPMTSNATGTVSFYDGRVLCNTPAELYIGGFYRVGNNSPNHPLAVLTASFPPSLTNASGQSIPFSEIQWTASANGETGAQVIPSGRFDTSPKTLSSWTRNTWNESCHSFVYDNTSVLESGVYTGRVTYTLSVL